MEEDGKEEEKKKREGKRKFSVEEEECIQKYFAENISTQIQREREWYC